jgi:DNA-binding CsgD family transcriptional regulator
MSAVSQQEHRAMLDCVGRLYGCDDREQFARVALSEIPKLIGSDHSTFNYVALCVPKVVVMATYEPPDHGQRQEVFSRYVSDHPILKHYLATGDGGAYKISDFQSVREYHNLPLYKFFYHDLKYEDQMTVELFPPGSELVSLALARDRRSFTERDRNVLNLLRPHVARAYRHAEQIGLMKRALLQRGPAQPEMRASSVLLDDSDRPLHFGDKAGEWLNHFFPEGSRHRRSLPDPVARWLERSRKPTAASRIPGGDSLARERGDQRLRLRVIPGLGDSGCILVLGLETISNAAQSRLANVLTRREIEVLLQVELGKTNEETATALGISPLTVRTHLEHIFEKLRVPSRTAAVTKFRLLCSRVTK